MARAKMRIELESAGIRELLQSEDVGRAVEMVGRGVETRAQRLGPRDADYTLRRFIGRDRQRVHIATANYAARVAESQARALTRALGGRA